MRRKAAFSVSIVTLGRPLVLYFGFWPTLPLLSTATGMLPFLFLSLSPFPHPPPAYRHLTSFFLSLTFVFANWEKGICAQSLLNGPFLSITATAIDLKRDRRVDLFLFFSIGSGTAAWESLPDFTIFLHHSVRYFRTFSSLFRGGIKTTTNRWTPVQPAIEPAFPCVTRIIFNLAKIFGYPLSNRSKSP